MTKSIRRMLLFITSVFLIIGIISVLLDYLGILTGIFVIAGPILLILGFVLMAICLKYKDNLGR